MESKIVTIRRLIQTKKPRAILRGNPEYNRLFEKNFKFRCRDLRNAKKTYDFLYDVHNHTYTQWIAQLQSLILNGFSVGKIEMVEILETGQIILYPTKETNSQAFCRWCEGIYNNSLKVVKTWDHKNVFLPPVYSNHTYTYDVPWDELRNLGIIGEWETDSELKYCNPVTKSFVRSIKPAMAASIEVVNKRKELFKVYARPNQKAKQIDEAVLKALSKLKGRGQELSLEIERQKQSDDPLDVILDSIPGKLV
jgi:hypothetical protein